MSFWSGVWRLLGAAGDEADEQAVYEHPAVARQSASGRERADEPLEESSAELVVHVLRPDRDSQGKATFSIKRYSEHLKEFQAVILDIRAIVEKDHVEAVRIVDVLTGVAEGIDGNVWEVAENVFFFAPGHLKLKGMPVRRLEVS